MNARLADPRPVLDPAPRPAPSTAPGGGRMRRNALWALAGNAAQAASQWGLLVILSRLGTPADVGRFALGLAVATPILMLANLQLRNVLVSDARSRFAFRDYLALRLVTTGLALGAIAAAALLGGFGREAAAAILSAGLAKSVESLGDLLHGLLQRHERMDRVAESLIAGSALSLGAFALVYATTASLTAALLALAACWAARLLARDLPAAISVAGADFRPRWDPATLRTLALLSAPLGLNMMFLSLNVNIPRYYIEGRLGPAGLGVFAAISYPWIAGTLVLNSLGQAAIPRLSRAFAVRDDSSFGRLLAKLLAAGVGLGLAGVVLATVAGGPILGLLYGPGYEAAAPAFAWLAVSAAAGMVASPLGYAMTAARVFRPQAPLFAVVAATTLAASALLVPDHGLVGAAWAVLVSQVVQTVGSLAILAGKFSDRKGAPGELLP